MDNKQDILERAVIRAKTPDGFEVEIPVLYRLSHQELSGEMSADIAVTALAEALSVVRSSPLFVATSGAVGSTKRSGTVIEDEKAKVLRCIPPWTDNIEGLRVIEQDLSRISGDGPVYISATDAHKNGFMNAHYILSLSAKDAILKETGWPEGVMEQLWCKEVSDWVKLKKWLVEYVDHYMPDWNPDKSIFDDDNLRKLVGSRVKRRKFKAITAKETGEILLQYKLQYWSKDDAN